ncbi:unnamed protein product [Symbiodinium sp. CCMP2456]|nr:unnamed protein product [Symbiodinium sp. CCMP2456]
MASSQLGSCVLCRLPLRTLCALGLGPLATLVTEFGRDHSCPSFVEWFFDLQNVHFSMCMHGGQHKKDTRLRATPGVFDVLKADCDGAHEHLPYGYRWTAGAWTFDTASEAQYPRLLCQRMVRAASEAVSPALLRDATARFRLDSLAAVGSQTMKHPPLIPEFKSMVWSLCRMFRRTSALALRALPAGPLHYNLVIVFPPPLNDAAAETLAWTLLQQGQVSQDEALQLVSLLSQASGSRRAKQDGLAWMSGAYVFGSQTGLHSATRTFPFVTALFAQTVVHFVPEVAFTSMAVFADFYGPEHVDKHNDHSYLNVIIPLSSFQQGGVAVGDQVLPVASGPCLLQSALPHRVLPAVGQRVGRQIYENSHNPHGQAWGVYYSGEEHVQEDKCLALFRELVNETKFPDQDVCQFMEEGVSLVGVEPSSALFPSRPKPMRATPEQLDSQAVWRRRVLLAKPPQILRDEELEILNSETEDECRLGFLEGPFPDEAAVTKRLGTEEWSPSQRFLLFQGEDRKPRVIDNLRDSGVNASFGSTSHLQMHDIDFVTAVAMFVADVWSRHDEVRVLLSSGEVLSGPWHPDSKKAEWAGRCFDLSKAYKQVPVLEESLKYAVIAMPGRDRQWTFYLARGLPFGGSGSVFAFNKISRALWHIAVEKLRLVTSVFVDDFPTPDLMQTSSSASDSFSRLLTALGWTHVANKEGRSDRIQALADRMCQDGEDLRQLATSLHGLLNFASGFTLGSSLKPIARTCSRIASRPASFGAEAIKQMNDLLKATLSSWRPRKLHMTDPRKPVILYTDGSYEGGRAMWGAFFIDPESDHKVCLSGLVPSLIRKVWLLQAGEQIICEIELFAVVCAKWVFGRRMANRKAFIFIDNNSALATLVKRNSQSDAMFRLMSLINVMDSVYPVGAWYHRVPSKSNPADLPSRDESDLLCRTFGARDKGEFAPPGEMVRFITEPTFTAASLELAVRAYGEHQERRG